LLPAALYWKRSTKWGAFAATAWVAASVGGIAVFQSVVTKPGVVWALGGAEIVTRTPAGTLFLGYLPVVPMTVVSALLIVVVSLVTRPPGESVLARYS
jgi:Na+/proline symporter